MPATAKGALGPAYLIVGGDQLKREAALARLKRRMGEGDFALFNMDERTASGDLDPAELVSSLRTLPFGSDFRLVILHVPDKLSKQLSDALVDYLARPNEACVFAVDAPKLAKNTRLYKAIQATGKTAIVDCSPKKRWELPEYLGRMAKSRGIGITRGAIDELISRVGESTVMLDNQIATLAELLAGKQAIEQVDVERYVARVEEVKWWDVVDALCERSLPRVLRLFSLMPDDAHVLLQTQIAQRFRELICAKSLADRGRAQDLASELGSPDWRVKNHLRWARSFSEDELVRALVGCGDLEQAIKGSGDATSAFTTYFVRTCAA